MEVAYFKKHQRGKTYHYYKVFGGKGNTINGYQEVINFLNALPIISIEHNQLDEATGTWCTYETCIPITKEEYQLAFDIAVSDEFCIK